MREDSLSRLVTLIYDESGSTTQSGKFPGMMKLRTILLASPGSPTVVGKDEYLSRSTVRTQRIKNGELSKDAVLTIPPIEFEPYYSFDFPKSERNKSLPILHFAIGFDDKKMIDYLLSFHQTVDKIQPALLFAIKHSEINIVEKLLAAGGNINDPMLFSTAIYNNRIEIANFLIDQGALCDSKISFEGCSSLVIAAKHNYVNLMKILIDNGADVNFLSSNRGKNSTWTPLMAACSTSAREAIEILLNHPNIDVNIVDHNRENCNFYINTLSSMSKINHNLLLNTNININIRNINGKLLIESSPSLALIFHIVALMVAGLDVSERNIEASGARIYKKLQAKYLQEIELLKSTKELMTNWSCFRILRTSQHLLALRFKHLQIPEHQGEEWSEKFPIYGKMLAFNFKKALQRKILLKKTDQVLFDILYRKLPATFINDLYHYMSNYNLSKLVE
ncbi:Similar to FANK1: Fibronectin type 3 and ankyrin repeat domains protein 1 (Bos taurus) [Cotesia congregata]|uniref:Similar to FANK1: Fibronectin type 3 and ankyrin repeat domains protein 1 (Bos taurus) n=1 Tax=Cotesia congregata TaxID=51543 RepID=A0A8J2E1H4_COTCN|nr:Similar to FANK1: Fibronectin type 3 and ankyrin repeat domains protein 1 (Bos taurus) [Cotesia congregata]